MAFATLELVLVKFDISNTTPSLEWEYNIQPKEVGIAGDTFFNVLMMKSTLLNNDSPFYTVAVKSLKSTDSSENKYMLTVYHQTSSSDKKENSIDLILEEKSMTVPFLSNHPLSTTLISDYTAIGFGTKEKQKFDDLVLVSILGTFTGEVRTELTLRKISYSSSAVLSIFTLASLDINHSYKFIRFLAPLPSSSCWVGICMNHINEATSKSWILICHQLDSSMSDVLVNNGLSGITYRNHERARYQMNEYFMPSNNWNKIIM